MRLGRLAVVGLAAGLLIGFGIALLAPRRRQPADPVPADRHRPTGRTIDLTGSAPSAGDTGGSMVDDGPDDVTAPGSDDETVARTR